jgi:hypothetical protein
MRRYSLSCASVRETMLCARWRKAPVSPSESCSSREPSGNVFGSCSDTLYRSGAVACRVISGARKLCSIGSDVAI